MRFCFYQVKSFNDHKTYDPIKICTWDTGQRAATHLFIRLGDDEFSVSRVPMIV